MSKVFGEDELSYEDQIKSIADKIQLFEHARQAQAEIDRSILEGNSRKIHERKEQIQQMCKDLVDIDTGKKRMTSTPFDTRGQDKFEFLNKTDQEVLESIEVKRLVRIKQVDAQRHLNQTYQKCLEELESEYEIRSQLVRAPELDKDNEEALTLENKLEEVKAKIKEAETINATFLSIKENLQNVSPMLQADIELLTEERQKYIEQLRNLVLMLKGAEAEGEEYKAEFLQVKAQLNREHKVRVEARSNLTETVEEYRMMYKEMDKMIRRKRRHKDARAVQDNASKLAAEDDEANYMSSLKNVFKGLTEVTGTTDVQDMVDQFILQKKTCEDLVKKKDENEAAVLKLKEQQTLLSQKLEDLKRPEEAESSSDEQTLEEEEAEQKPVPEEKPKLPNEPRLFRTLIDILNRVKHTAQIMQCSACEDEGEEVDPDSGDLAAVLMDQVTSKVQEIASELQGTDVVAKLKEKEKKELITVAWKAFPVNVTQMTHPSNGAPNMAQ